MSKNKALGELALAYAGVAIFSFFPNPVAAVRLYAARKACRSAGMSESEITEAIKGFSVCAQEAFTKTFPKAQVAE